MKQYRIFYRRNGADKWGTLDPGVHASLYEVPPVQSAVDVLRTHPAIEAVCVRHEDAILNVVVFDQPALAPQAFVLGE